MGATLAEIASLISASVSGRGCNIHDKITAVGGGVGICLLSFIKVISRSKLIFISAMLLFGDSSLSSGYPTCICSLICGVVIIAIIVEASPLASLRSLLRMAEDIAIGCSGPTEHREDCCSRV